MPENRRIDWGAPTSSRANPFRPHTDAAEAPAASAASIVPPVGVPLETQPPDSAVGAPEPGVEEDVADELRDLFGALTPATVSPDPVDSTDNTDSATKTASPDATPTTDSADSTAPTASAPDDPATDPSEASEGESHVSAMQAEPEPAAEPEIESSVEDTPSVDSTTADTTDTPSSVKRDDRRPRDRQDAPQVSRPGREARGTRSRRPGGDSSGNETANRAAREARAAREQRRDTAPARAQSGAGASTLGAALRRADAGASAPSDWPSTLAPASDTTDERPARVPPADDRRTVTASAKPAPSSAPPSPEVPAPPAASTESASRPTRVVDTPPALPVDPERERERREALERQARLDEEARVQESMRRYADLAQDLLEQVGRDIAVSGELAKLQLTRDHELDRAQREEFQRVLEPYLARVGVPFTDPRDVARLFDVAYDTVLGLGPLGPMWRDDSVSEIMVNGPDRIFVEVAGRLYDTQFRFNDAEHVQRIARDLAQRVSGRQLSNESSLVTAELPGARVNFAYGPVTRTGAVITIRKFSDLLAPDALLSLGALDEEMHDFLRDCVAARANVIVSGGTGAGKTTVINALSSFIPSDERVITIEDAFELNLVNHHVVALQTKERASGDDHIETTLSELMINSLRMRPDRIVVGEVRDGDAATVLLDAANTGHDGTMTTIHGDSPLLTLNDRLAVLIRERRNVPDDVARRTIASAVNLVVQVARGRFGRRLITEIAVVDASYIVDGLIVPRPIFVGRVATDGSTVFERVGGIDPASNLYRRFETAGIDSARWEVQP